MPQHRRAQVCHSGYTVTAGEYAVYVSRSRRTYRVVDGQQMPGTWRPIFIHNVNYYLTELYIYADGVDGCKKRSGSTSRSPAKRIA